MGLNDPWQGTWKPAANGRGGFYTDRNAQVWAIVAKQDPIDPLEWSYTAGLVLPANVYGAAAGKVKAAGQDRDQLLQDIDSIAYEYKLGKAKGAGFPWWLVLLGLLVASDKGRR